MAHGELLFGAGSVIAPPRVFIIAEIGVNHDGGVGRALELIDVAHDTGADAVKLQWFAPQRLLSAEAQLALYQQSPTQEEDGGGGVHGLLESLMLSLDEMRRLRDAAKQAGLRFVLTPFSVGDVADVGQLKVDAVKIASPDAVNPPLLTAAAALDKPLIISTGTCELEELTFAADLLRGHAAGGALLQCVSSYPTPDTCAALGAIRVMAEHFGLPIGYSDHTTAVDTGALAVAAGACVLEKHLTYDTRATGPDHAASLAPGDFVEYVRLARRAAGMVGPAVKQVLEVEADVRAVSRQSWCATRDLPKGYCLREEDVTPKRPGTGIPVAVVVCGLRLARAVRADHLLHWEDVAGKTKDTIHRGAS